MLFAEKVEFADVRIALVDGGAVWFTSAVSFVRFLWFIWASKHRLTPQQCARDLSAVSNASSLYFVRLVP